MPGTHRPDAPRVHILGPTPAKTSARIVEGLVRAVPGQEGATVVNACGRCGSARHGPLVIMSPIPLWASLSRTAEVTVVAISDIGPVGVDIEDIDAFAGVRDALHRWCAVESALKATGEGLRIDPDDVHLVAGDWAEEATLALPDGATVQVRPLDTGPRQVGAIAIGLRASATLAG